MGQNKAISPGSIGGKIKKYREFRGYTQKELGIKCGFSETTADVRIAQYEKNQKTPRPKVLKAISIALGVDEEALYETDLSDRKKMIHALFDLEEYFGLRPVESEDGMSLIFCGEDKAENDAFLHEWLKEYEKYYFPVAKTMDELNKRGEDYVLWCSTYSKNKKAM